MAVPQKIATTRLPPRIMLPRLPLELEGPAVREYLARLLRALEGYTHTLWQDVVLGRVRWPIKAAADVNDAVRGSLQFEDDGTREYVWAKHDSGLRMLTNCPEKNEIIYKATVTNDGTGKADWTFPLGGFKEGPEPPRIQATLNYSVAHGWQYVHQVSIAPLTTTNTSVRIYFDEFDVVDVPPAMLSFYPCTNTDMHADVIAMGEPP